MDKLPCFYQIFVRKETFYFNLRAPSRSDSLLRDSTLPEFTRHLSHLSVKLKSPEPPKREKGFKQPDRHAKSLSSQQTLTPRTESPGGGTTDLLEPTEVKTFSNFDGRYSSRGVDQVKGRSESRSQRAVTSMSQRASSLLTGREEEFERPLSRAIGIPYFSLFGFLKNKFLKDLSSSHFVVVLLNWQWFVFFDSGGWGGPFIL